MSRVRGGTRNDQAYVLEFLYPEQSLDIPKSLPMYSRPKPVASYSAIASCRKDNGAFLSSEADFKFKRAFRGVDSDLRAACARQNDFSFIHEKHLAIKSGFLG